MDWNAWGKAIHQNAVEHGFWDTKRELEETMVLFHCELSEAIEELRKGNPDIYQNKDGKWEGTYVELADCAIRILDFLAQQGENAEPDYSNHAKLPEMPIIEAIMRCHSHIGCAYDYRFDESTMFKMLRIALGDIVRMLERAGYSIEQVIADKHEYNRGRAYKHGKKF
jgi:NTP pyrophosphatase (non-canonical NTP hydrolase)